jgi:uncharacterized membrane protein YqhA
MVDEGQHTRPPLGGRESGGWLLRVVASIRFFVVFAVLGAFLSAVMLYVYGTLAVAEIAWDTLRRRDVSVDGAKKLEVSFVVLTDVFLLGTVLVVVAIGLYQLFLQSDLPLPPWLRVRSLSQLSAQLIDVVAVLLGVTFLAIMVETNATEDILDIGVAVAVVIAALSLLLIVSHRIGGDSDPPHGE